MGVVVVSSPKEGANPTGLILDDPTYTMFDRVSLYAAESPTATLKDPETLLLRAQVPMATFLEPILLEYPDINPLKVL